MMETIDKNYLYNKKDLIGHGAFAIVYKGRHIQTNTEVAVKAIAKKNINKVKNLLQKEIKISKELSNLKHRNLVALLKCTESETHVFLVMEYCDAGDLADYLNTYERLSEETIQHFFSQIAKALEAMQKKNVVHRDLKPQNILLCNPHKKGTFNVPPKQLIVKLADFGFARELSGNRMAGTLCGSPMYMAPEVIMSQQYCAKADLWSVGTIMYQCLTGKAPFIAQTPQQLKSKYENAKELLPHIPSYCSFRLSDLLISLLKKDPRDRIEFVDFFNHPFLHTSIDSTPTNQQNFQNQRQITSTATTQMRTKFSLPSNCNGASNNTGNINASPQRILNQTTTGYFNTNNQKITQINPTSLGQHKYGSFGTPISRLPSALPIEGTKQTLLRPYLNASPVHQTNIPTSYGANYSSTRFQSQNYNNEEQRNNTLSKPHFSSNTAQNIVSNSPPRSYLFNNQMMDSNDFTFLPPLDKRQPQNSQEPNITQKNLNLQFSNASTSNLKENSAVKQVQVHSSATSDRGDPVPSQRLVYAQMQERRKVAASSPVSNVSVAALVTTRSNMLGTTNNCCERRIPSVEELNLPETQFLVHEMPKTSRRNLFNNNNLINILQSDKTTQVKTIAKSATCNEFQQTQLKSFSNKPNNSKPISEEKSSPAGIVRTMSIPVTKASNLTDNNQNSILTTNSLNTEIKISDEKKRSNENLINSNEDNIQKDSINHHSFVNKKIGNNVYESMEESLMSQVTNSISCDEEMASAGHERTSFNRKSQKESTTQNNTSTNSTNVTSTEQNTNLLQNDCRATDNANADLLFNVDPPSELDVETILDDDHRQVLAKLRFVLDLIETLINVAEKKTNPIVMMMEGGTRKSRHQSSVSSEANRRAEQLVLYVRSLHVLSSALVMAQRQIHAEVLKPSPAVQFVLNQLNEKYHYCLARSQELASLGIPGSDPTRTVVSAERIMYQHAIDLCQSAALDELFGHPQLCPKRYQTAYMMLHTLFEQVQNEQDKNVLAKYKNAVEKRMRILEQQGFVKTVNLNEQNNLSHFHSPHQQDLHKNILKESNFC